MLIRFVVRKNRKLFEIYLFKFKVDEVLCIMSMVEGFVDDEYVGDRKESEGYGFKAISV